VNLGIRGLGMTKLNLTLEPGTYTITVHEKSAPLPPSYVLEEIIIFQNDTLAQRAQRLFDRKRVRCVSARTCCQGMRTKRITIMPRPYTSTWEPPNWWMAGVQEIMYCLLPDGVVVD